MLQDELLATFIDSVEKAEMIVSQPANPCHFEDVPGAIVSPVDGKEALKGQLDGERQPHDNGRCGVPNFSEATLTVSSTSRTRLRVSILSLSPLPSAEFLH
jgi:hypothetical protein